MSSEGAGANEVFRRSAMNRVASSDELDHYIKVTNPSAWIVALAALFLIGGVIVWALVAVVPVTVETTGVMLKIGDSDETVVTCWVDKTTTDRISELGLTAIVDGIEAKSATLREAPMSASAVISFLGSDFYIDSIELNEWNYLVLIEPAVEPSHTDFSIMTSAGQAYLVPVSIVVSETRPINIALGKKG